MKRDFSLCRRTASEYSRELSEHAVAIVRVFDGKLAFLDYRIEIKENLRFLVAFAKEDLHRCPIARRFWGETAPGSLRLIVSKGYEGERKTSHFLNLYWKSLGLKRFLQIGK